MRNQNYRGRKDIYDMKNTSLRNKATRFRQYIPLVLLTLPGIVYLIINNYIPIGGLYIAFKSVNYSKGFWNSPWCGFKNFKYLFATADAWIITRNTVCYNLVFIVVNTVVAVIIAIMLSDLRSKRLLKGCQTAILLPYMLSIVIVSYIVYALLAQENGFMNNTVLALLGKDPVSWYSEKKAWPVILVLVNMWKQVGYLAIVYFSSVVGINTEYYEAARIDGASKLQQIRYVTLPLLKPTIVIMTLLSVGRIFSSDFGLFYQVPRDSGALYDVTNTIDTYVYRSLLQNGNVGMSSAAGVYQSIVGFILVISANLIVRKIDSDNALF